MVLAAVVAVMWVAPVAAAQVPPESGWYCLAHRDGTYACLDRRPAAAELGDVRFLWHGDAQSPSRRFEPDELPGEGTSASAERLTIRIAGLEPEQATGVVVIAAPAAMWAEVPESLLPRWPLPATGRVRVPWDAERAWRVRVAGTSVGTWWHDVPRGRNRAALRVEPAVPVEIAVTDEEGQPAARVTALVRERPAGGRSALRTTALIVGDARGVLAWTGMPVATRIDLLVNSPEHIAASLSLPVDDSPAKLQLARGASVTGRILDSSGEPVADVALMAEGWTDGETGALIQARGQTAADGRFSLGPLPRSPAHLGAAKHGFVPLRRSLSLAEGDADLGDVTLEASVEARVKVLDPNGTPVAGAVIEGPGIRPRATDGTGRATIPGLAGDTPTVLSVTAEGFLPREARLRPPFDDVSEIILAAAFRVAGRFVGADALPVPSASLVLWRGSRSERPPLDPDGHFRLDLPPGVSHKLVLGSPTTREVSVALAPGIGGDERDLGDIEAPPGRTVVGRLIRADDGGPIAGAAVSSLRSAGREPLFAWAFGDHLTARSGVDGGFRLSGLDAGTARLSVERPGFARREVVVTVEADRAETELGAIELHTGATVVLEVVESEDGSAREGAEARLDLGNRWFEMDMMRAPVREGWARFRHVPAGEATATVIRGGTLVCETVVAVAPDDEHVAARCEATSLAVTGFVTVAREPVGPGTLSWSVPGSEAPPGLILNQHSPSGLVRQEVFGAGRPQVNVPVAPDGYFATDALRPGRWEAAWIPEAGSMSQTRIVTLPDSNTAEIALDFPGHWLEGRVETEDGEPAPGARVRETSTGTIAIAGPDATFRFTGVAAGERFLKAQLADLESAPMRVELVAGERALPVVLVLRPAADEGAKLVVVDPDGVPAAGALVFVEVGGGVRILTANADGEATLRLDPPYPQRLRFAAHGGGRWALGGWLAWPKVAAATSTLTLAPGGSLEVASAALTGSLRIVDGDGWDVSMLLSRLGIRPRLAAGSSTRVDGLPPGPYEVALGEARETTSVGVGEVALVELD